MGRASDPRPSSRVRTLLQAVGVLALALSLSEAGVRVLGLDLRLPRQGLKYVRMDLRNQEVAPDPFVRYRPAPGSRAEYAIGGPDCGSGVGVYHVAIGPLGEREPSHPADKAPGTFRIAILGASSTYGSCVDDDRTLPADLERILDRDAGPAVGGPRFEVLNFADGAWQVSQMARVARQVLAARHPDLLVLQSNPGERRAFLGTGEAIAALDLPVLEGPDVLDENFPAPWIGEAAHRLLFHRSGLYRALDGLLRSRCPTCADQERRGNDRGERANQREFRALAAEAQAAGVPIHLFSIPVRLEVPRTGIGTVTPMVDREHLAGLPGVTMSALVVDGDDPATFRAHPPEAALERWAEDLADDLERLGRVPVGTIPPPAPRAPGGGGP